MNAVGVDALKVALRLGVAAEAVASVGIGLALLLVFREQSPPRCSTPSAPRR